MLDFRAYAVRRAPWPRAIVPRVARPFQALNLAALYEMVRHSQGMLVAKTVGGAEGGTRHTHGRVLSETGSGVERASILRSGQSLEDVEESVCRCVPEGNVQRAMVMVAASNSACEIRMR